jgi:hypothetical protein
VKLAVPAPATAINDAGIVTTAFCAKAAFGAAITAVSKITNKAPKMRCRGAYLLSLEICMIFDVSHQLKVLVA